MKHSNLIPFGCVIGLVAGSAVFAYAPPVLADGVTAAETYAIVRGGKLYDKWYTLSGGGRPKGTHKAWPKSNTKKKGATTHHCKSCHGWDYMGKDGAYGSGSYKTGIPGIGAYAGANIAKITAVLGNAIHELAGKMPEKDMGALALFVSKGQVDMRKHINYGTKKPMGDANKGGAYYASVCSNCHGRDGKKPKDMKSFGKQMGNPWEVMHKILNGHPGEDMPAMRVVGPQMAADTMTYMMTLPK
ncbi:MAG: cytochrome c [Rhodospirillaceae bacterium]|nr:cytochrome c [Rhodospirillaceae bacterium]MBT6883984.1 cytochrome c [Rhodospirillaceae bacterium]